MKAARLLDAEFQQQKHKATEKFRALEEIPNALVPVLIDNGIRTFDDLSIVDPDWLSSNEGVTDQMAEAIVDAAERRSEPVFGSSSVFLIVRCSFTFIVIRLEFSHELA